MEPERIRSSPLLLLQRGSDITLHCWCKAKRCALDNNICSYQMLCRRLVLQLKGSDVDIYTSTTAIPCCSCAVEGLGLWWTVHWCDSSSLELVHTPESIWYRYTSAGTPARSCSRCMFASAVTPSGHGRVITHHEPHLDTRIICTLCYCRICSYKL